MAKITYFGLTIHGDESKYVLKSDIKKLPFYDFWKESARGSVMLSLENDGGVYLLDWENFCVLFLKTGKHRYSND